jgi:hypothetical protein
VERVSHATHRADEGGCKVGGIRLGKSISTLVKILRNLTSRLRVVVRLLWDVGRLPGNMGRVLLEVERQATDFSESSHISFFTPSGREGKKKKRRKSVSARNKQSLPGFA